MRSRPASDNGHIMVGRVTSTMHGIMDDGLHHMVRGNTTHQHNKYAHMYSTANYDTEFGI